MIAMLNPIKTVLASFFPFLVFCLASVTNNALAQESTNNTGFNQQIEYWPTNGWRSSTPEQQGMSSAGLSQLFTQIQRRKLDIYSLLVVRNGYIVVEANKGEIDNTYPIYSSTKSITSALVGIAIDKGLIRSVEQRVYPLLSVSPDKIQEQKSVLQIKHLLNMSCALQWPEIALGYAAPNNPIFQMMRSNNWVDYALQKSMSTVPGKEFNYNSGCSHLLSAIIDKTSRRSTGLSAEEFAQAQLFSPLGISKRQYNWRRDPQGIVYGGSGLSMRPRDMAKIGQLFLTKGHWQGKQIIARSWVEQSTKEKISLPWQGMVAEHYAYQWYVQPFGFNSLGYKGQYIFVLPALNIVVVVTANLDQQQFVAPIQLVKDFVVPAAILEGKLVHKLQVQRQLTRQLKHFSDH
ncbi:MAG: hypothetical protein OFPI_15130 [Osedax symbiont Rs2]|nr:MAG: hypothetical protein OFPI_15130 [Osedax symbiont Rs2]